MNKILTFLVIIAIIFGLYKLTSRNPNVKGVDESVANLVVYWGEGCPHCETVKEYITTNQLDQKIKISLKEVYNNPSNQQDLEAIAKTCQEIDISQGIGVPFGYVPDEKICLYGDQPIIDWLKNR